MKKLNKTDDLKQEITNKIINLMKKNKDGWIKCWVEEEKLKLPINSITNKYYTGINIIKLWLAQKNTNKWATYKQWKENGNQVKKGEKGTNILRYIQIEKDSENEEYGVIPIMKVFSVFNADQLKGYEATKNQGNGETFNHSKADKFIINTKAKIKFNDDKNAYYSEIQDFINMPKMQDFINTKDSKASESYYGTIFHELIHWTGHKKRLNRKNFDINNNKNSYAYEELIAELGSCFLCIYLKTEPIIRKDHAKYLNSWIKILKNDTKIIFKAAAEAGKAFDYLLKLQK